MLPKREKQEIALSIRYNERIAFQNYRGVGILGGLGIPHNNFEEESIVLDVHRLCMLNVARCKLTLPERGRALFVRPTVGICLGSGITSNGETIPESELADDRSSVDVTNFSDVGFKGGKFVERDLLGAGLT